MKNIPCQLPDPEEFPEKLYMHFRGKAAIPLVVVMASWFLAFAHDLVGITQLWTLAILGFCFIYGIIPTKWYMQTVYHFFIGSFIGALYISTLFYYIGWLFFIESGLYSSTALLVIGIVILYFILFFIELYQSLGKVSTCKKIIKQSIINDNDEGLVFSIGNWINRLNKYSLNASNSFATTFFLILIVPVIIVGFIGGGPLVSAKILMSNNEDVLVSLIICIGLIALSIVLIPFAVKELLKVIALVQLSDEL